MNALQEAVQSPAAVSTITSRSPQDDPDLFQPAVAVTVERHPRWASEPEPPITVRVSGDQVRIAGIQGSRWFGPVIAALLPLLDLPRNWNTHGAEPVQPAALNEALAALITLLHPDTRPPLTFATANGGVNFEWSTTKFSLELSADRDSGVVLSYSDDQREWDGPPGHAPSFVEDALKQLALG